MSIEHLGKAIIASIKDSARQHRESGSRSLSSAADAINQGDIETAKQLFQEAEPDFELIRQKEEAEREIQEKLDALLLALRNAQLDDPPVEEGATILIDSIPSLSPGNTNNHKEEPESPKNTVLPPIKPSGVVNHINNGNGLPVMDRERIYPMTEKEYFAMKVYLRLMDDLAPNIELDVIASFNVIYPDQLRSDLPETPEGFIHVLRNNYKWGRTKIASSLQAVFGLGDLVLPITSSDLRLLSQDPKVKDIIEKLSRVRQFSGLNLCDILDAYSQEGAVSIEKVVEKITSSAGHENNGKNLKLGSIPINQLVRLIDSMNAQEFTWSVEYQRAAMQIKGTVGRTEKLSHPDRTELLDRTIAMCRCNDKDWEKFAAAQEPQIRTVLTTVRNFYRKRPDKEIEKLLSTRKKK